MIFIVKLPLIMMMAFAVAVAYLPRSWSEIFTVRFGKNSTLLWIKILSIFETRFEWTSRYWGTLETVLRFYDVCRPNYSRHRKTRTVLRHVAFYGNYADYYFSLQKKMILKDTSYQTFQSFYWTFYCAI